MHFENKGIPSRALLANVLQPCVDCVGCQARISRPSGLSLVSLWLKLALFSQLFPGHGKIEPMARRTVVQLQVPGNLSVWPGHACRQVKPKGCQHRTDGRMLGAGDHIWHQFTCPVAGGLAGIWWAIPDCNGSPIAADVCGMTATSKWCIPRYPRLYVREQMSGIGVPRSSQYSQQHDSIKCATLQADILQQ